MRGTQYTAIHIVAVEGIYVFFAEGSMSGDGFFSKLSSPSSKVIQWSQHKISCVSQC